MGPRVSWSAPDEHGGRRPPTPASDPDLLEHGDTRQRRRRLPLLDPREAIVAADIDRRRHRLHVAIENFGNDANIGAVVRTANAFAVHTVHIVGRRRWNRRAPWSPTATSTCHHGTTPRNCSTSPMPPD